MDKPEGTAVSVFVHGCQISPMLWWSAYLTTCIHGYLDMRPCLRNTPPHIRPGHISSPSQELILGAPHDGSGLSILALTARWRGRWLFFPIG